MPGSYRQSQAPDTPESILVLAREHIGDLVCTTPALRSIRQRYPNAHIAIEVGERAACVLENCPYIDELILRPNRQGATGKVAAVLAIRRRRFDLGLILDDSADMPLHLYLGGVRYRVGLTRKPRFARLLSLQVPYDFTAHEMVDNFLSVARAVGGDDRDRRPALFPSLDDVEAADAILCDAGIDPSRRIVALNPGASAPSNRWPTSDFAALGDMLNSLPGVSVAILGGPGDKELGAAIADGMNSTPIRLTGKLTLLQLAAAMRCFRVVVTGDTGPMHVAAAMRTPIVALFGPAVPAESGPLYVPGNIVIRKVQDCPGCTKYACRDNGSCMKRITPCEVADAVERILTGSPILSGRSHTPEDSD